MDKRNLLAALAVAALFIAAATTAGCATSTNPSPTPTPIPATQTASGNNTTFSSAAGFSITYPKDLKADTTSNASVPVRIYIYVNPKDTADGVLVATQGTTLSTGKTLNDYVNYSRYNLQNYSISGFYKNFSILSETNTTLGGKPAHTIVFSGIFPTQYNATATKELSLKQMQTYVVGNNNKTYTITYKATSGDYDTYLAQAQRIINSIAFT